jgi:hypothetical protein
LAGVTREIAIFRKLTGYSPLLAGAIHGSPDSLGPEVLHQKAAHLISAHSELARDTTLREMDEAAGRGLLVTDPAAVIDAARGGQIDELIVSPAAPGFSQREEEINWTALATIRAGGTVSLADAPHLDKGFSAILRYRQAAGDVGTEPVAAEALEYADAGAIP